jgi:glycosyltransferase involved in cell wall biosynthesis
MYKDSSVAIIVPAFNEERHIELTLSGIPPYVDSIVVVDDGSSDSTVAIAEKYASTDPRVAVLTNGKNQGKGVAVVRGCKLVIEEGRDFIVLMDGDNQMPSEHLESLLDAVIDNDIDGAKGNRFIAAPRSLAAMPKYRMIGNVLLTMLTKLASGYWSLFDSQNGYWAIRTRTLAKLDLDRLARRYNLESSLLINLNIIEAKVRDVPIPARYADEKSKIRVWRVTPHIVFTLMGGLVKRLWYRYVLYNFHPVALFLFAGLPLMLWGILFGIFVVATAIGDPVATTGTVMLAVLPFLMGFQLLLAALVLDILSEPK